MNETLKQRMIERILNDHEPDQILIDILRVDLYSIAESELANLNE